MRIETKEGQLCIVLEHSGDIAKVLLALSYSERNDLIPQSIIEALEEEMGE